MIVVSFISEPGSGKSTSAMELTSDLKKLGYIAEYVPEQIKREIYLDNSKAYRDQIYLTAMQNHNISILDGEVDIAVCDSSILHGFIYNKDESISELLDQLVMTLYNRYNNILFMLNRTHNYVKDGRFQTEYESRIDRLVIEKYIDDRNIKVDGTFSGDYSLWKDKAIDIIVNKIKEIN